MALSSSLTNSWVKISFSALPTLLAKKSNLGQTWRRYPPQLHTCVQHNATLQQLLKRCYGIGLLWQLTIFVFFPYLKDK